MAAFAPAAGPDPLGLGLAAALGVAALLAAGGLPATIMLGGRSVADEWLWAARVAARRADAVAVLMLWLAAIVLTLPIGLPLCLSRRGIGSEAGWRRLAVRCLVLAGACAAAGHGDWGARGAVVMVMATLGCGLAGAGRPGR